MASRGSGEVSAEIVWVMGDDAFPQFRHLGIYRNVERAQVLSSAVQAKVLRPGLLAHKAGESCLWDGQGGELHALDLG